MKTINLINLPMSKEEKMRLNRQILGAQLKAHIASSVTDAEVLEELRERNLPHHPVLDGDQESYPMDQP